MSMKRIVSLLILLLGVLSTMAQAYPAKKYDLRFFQVSFGNDTFVNTDRSFTHGGKLTMMSNNIQNYQNNPLLRWFSLTNGKGSLHTFSVSIGQNVYTPSNIKTDVILKEDRPYAGYLYVGFGIHSSNKKRQDTFEIDIGIVGHQSFAEQTQRAIHWLFKHRDPKGWDHQLSNEFAIQTIFERKIRALRLTTETGVGIELIPHFGGGFGNVYIYANAGYQIRFGWNLPNDYGVEMHRPGGDTTVGIIRKENRPSIHIFAALDGQAVHKNIFLDGNTFDDSHYVHKYPFTANIMAGFGVRIHRFYFTYTYVYWTKKFKSEPENHRFGVMNISYSF
ncbi:lipid A deacylase LpxR family protein [Acidobacteriota bacterium]